MHNAQELQFSLLTHTESTGHDPTDYVYLEPNNRVGIESIRAESRNLTAHSLTSIVAVQEKHPSPTGIV